MSTYKLISSDSHIVEPPNLWQDRIDPKFKDRAPFMAEEEDTDQWYVDGTHKFGAIGVAGGAGLRLEGEASKLSLKGRFEVNVPKGGYDPHAHVKDMDVDDVAGGLLYPSEGLFTWGIPDTDLLSAVFRAYNDWLADFCKPYPDRLKGIAMINLDNVSEGIEELRRCVSMGMPGAMIATGPFVRYDDRRYDPFWDAAQDIGIPLAMHIGCMRSDIYLPAHQADMLNHDPVVFSAQVIPTVMTSIAAMIFGGVFERFPKLRVGAVEFEVSWVPYFLNRMDDTYKNRVAGYSGTRFQDDNALPSDFWLNNCFVGFQEDALGMELRHYVGVDNLLWGSDYPHGESTFPKSREIVADILKGVPEDEQAKIAGGNSARLYGFNLD
jgi:predicted TIM-barrel fold metal-dependent hydrolase